MVKSGIYSGKKVGVNCHRKKLEVGLPDGIPAKAHKEENEFID